MYKYWAGWQPHLCTENIIILFLIILVTSSWFVCLVVHNLQFACQFYLSYHMEIIIYECIILNNLIQSKARAAMRQKSSWFGERGSDSNSVHPNKTKPHALWKVSCVGYHFGMNHDVIQDWCLSETLMSLHHCQFIGHTYLKLMLCNATGL